MAKYLKKKWRKLDNVAKLFSLDDKKNTNIFRYSVILKQNINRKILKKAAEKSLEHFLTFKVKMGKGIFWNCLECNTKEIIVREEDKTPCLPIDIKKNNDYLFKVTYHKKKINLEMFHLLTDGTGAIMFLKSIIYHYLSLKYHLPLKEEKYFAINYSDSYMKYDYSMKTKGEKQKMAYQLPGKIKKNLNNTYHYTINIEKIKKICHKYQATLTEYITSLYIYSLYLAIYPKDEKKEIIITLPINLRKYYKVETLSNFFVCANISPKIREKNLTTFEEILREVKKEFQNKITKEKIKEYFSRDVTLGNNLFLHFIPLFIKKLGIKVVHLFASKFSTSTVSNVGIIEIDEPYKKYIDNIFVLVKPNRNQKIKCTICSFDKKLNITLNSNIEDDSLEKTFFKLLQKQVGNVKIESNCDISFIK